MNELQIFNNEEFGEVRTVIIDGKPMFCLADVCKALDISNPRNVKNRLKEDGVYTMDTLTNGGNQKMNYINESNLYKVIFQSRKESAERFTDWVTDEVLQSIRKTGSYNINEPKIDKTLLNPQMQLLITMTENLAMQEIEQKKQAERLQNVENRIDNVCDIIVTPIADWKSEINNMVRNISQKSNIEYQSIWNQLYADLESRAHCSLARLVENKIKRMEKAGNTKTTIKAETTKLAVIFDKPQLKEIFTNIVKEYSIKYA